MDITSDISKMPLLTDEMLELDDNGYYLCRKCSTPMILCEDMDRNVTFLLCPECKYAVIDNKPP